MEETAQDNGQIFRKTAMVGSYLLISLIASSLFYLSALSTGVSSADAYLGIVWVFVLSAIISASLLPQMMKKIPRKGGEKEGSRQNTLHIRKKEVKSMAIDPICGMEVDERTASATTVYQGKKYYFCAIGCKKRFESDPKKYEK